MAPVTPQPCAVSETMSEAGSRQRRLAFVQLPGMQHQRRPCILQGQGLQGPSHQTEGQHAGSPAPERRPGRAGPEHRGRQFPQTWVQPMGTPEPAWVANDGQWHATGIVAKTQFWKVLPPVGGSLAKAPFRSAVAHDGLARKILQQRLALLQGGPPGASIRLKGPLVGQAMQTNGMATRDDATQQLWVAPGLVPQTEPGGRGSKVRAELQGTFRGQGQPTFETIQSLWLVIGRAAELEPVLPVQGEGEAMGFQVKFRSERLMNSSEKSSSSVWNCLSWPWKKL